MGDIASINFKPTKLSIQEKHNDRSVMPSYVLKSGGLGIECNRNAQEARALRNGMIEKAKEDYKRCFNQPFKAKSYLWSAVVNLKPDSTMQDLERLTECFKEKYGFQCYQIAIHRDEGHVDDEGKEHINHHAHLEFVTLDEHTGKSMFRKGLITREVMSEIQTLTALVLQMKRGEYKNDHIDEQGNLIKGTGRKRIEPRAYGQLMERERKARQESEKELKSESNSLKNKLRAILNTLEDRVIKILEIRGETIKGICEKVNATTTINQINACMDFIKEDITQLELDKQELEKRPTLERAQKLEQQARTAQQELVRERRAGQDNIKGFCKELRKAMAGRGFKREHFSRLEQLANQANEQAISFSEFQRLALAIFGEYGEVFREQYKDYISPDDLEAKRFEDFKSLCLLADRYNMPKVAIADEAKKRVENSIQQLKSGKISLENDLMELCKLVGAKWTIPEYAKEDIEKSIKELQVQAGKTQELTTRAESAEAKANNAENDKAELEGAINTTYSALIEGQKAGDELTALDKLTAVEVKGLEVLKTIDTQQGTITELEGQVNQQAGEIKELKGELTNKTQELVTATQNATQSTESKQKVDTAFNDLKAKYEALEGDYNALQTQNTEDKGKIQKLNDELARLEAQVSTSSAPANPSAQSNPYQSPEQEYTALIAEINKLDPQIAQTLLNHFWDNSLSFVHEARNTLEALKKGTPPPQPPLQPQSGGGKRI
ncbi:AAA family ATPase [Helicobacter felis]|uniref:mobilization protein n=1 Tax=Helicobacter felis TaxID=214 RepID=UPI001F361C2B|nr:mobilization protein [Helicobacter felis]